MREGEERRRAMEKNEGRKWRKCTDGKNLGRKINKGCSRGRELGEAITGQAEPLTKGDRTEWARKILGATKHHWSAIGSAMPDNACWRAAASTRRVCLYVATGWVTGEP